MSNILEFPTKERKKQIQDQKDIDQLVNLFPEDTVEVRELLKEIIDIDDWWEVEFKCKRCDVQYATHVPQDVWVPRWCHKCDNEEDAEYLMVDEDGEIWEYDDE